MVDFTNSKEVFNIYSGSEKKKTLIYDGKKYLVKFPDPIREKNKTISYINNAFSEYVGSTIFKLCGFNTQNTLLGNYLYNGKNKIVCACEDFTGDSSFLIEFERLALSANPDKKIETEIDDIISVIDYYNDLIDTDSVKRQFWDMFIIDALIGNTNRHNGNWGFIMNEDSNSLSFAPIYDCGSCMNPMLDDSDIKELNDTEIKNLAINVYSCLKENNKKINYMSYIKSTKNDNVNNAILRVFNNIVIDDIYNFIDNISCMTMARKKFYKDILAIRYDIIKSVYDKLKA